MKRVPLWRRIASRPSWERDRPLRFSDLDPAMPVIASINRVRLALDRQAGRTAATLARLEEIEAARRAGRKP